MRLLFLALTFSLSVFGISQAQAGFNAGIRSAVVETKSTVDDLTQLQLKERLRKVISAMINRSALALREAGHSTQAAQLLREWSVIEPQIFLRSGYLGQHEPLSRWLATTHKTLEVLLGKNRLEQMHLDDIFVVNYAVPVVFNPNKGWSKREYGKHFVPLAGVATFWSSVGACMYAFNGRRAAFAYCGRLGVILEQGVSDDIAPMLSNFVFEKFTNRNFRGEFNITTEQIARRYGAELSAAPY